jgi:D-amino-acid dehydrogenase
MSHVVIIGGGVIGAACAYYLQKSGWRVTIIDRAEFGRGCSHSNCGFVCPSHVLPLAVPGAVGRTLRAQFQRQSPFSIKPRLDPSLWSWLWHFARRCNQTDMLETGRAIQALLNSSRSLYDELFATEKLDVEWETRGLLFVFLTREGMEHYGHTEELLREHFGLEAIRYDGQTLVDLEPALKPGLAGGWHYLTDGHLRPDKLMSAWQRLLVERSVKIQERCQFGRFVRLEDRADAVQTTDPTQIAAGLREISADAFVVATGAWAPQMNRELGCRVPIQPGKGYSITMPRPARCPRVPLIFEEHRVAVTPMQSGYRLGSIMEFSGYDSTLDRRRLDLLRDGASHYLHEPISVPIQEEWFGWRPMTYDSKPIIGRCPGWENVYLATGHNMLGLSMAPATGKLMTEMLNGQTPHIDPAPYSPERF